MGSGGDALVGSEVKPFLRVGAVKAYLQVEFRMVNEEGARESVHALPAKEDYVETAIDGYVYGGVGVDAVAPMNGAVGIP